MKDMPSAAQTGGSTEPNGCVLKHEKEELMDTSSPQQDINDIDRVTISFYKDIFLVELKEVDVEKEASKTSAEIKILY